MTQLPGLKIVAAIPQKEKGVEGTAILKTWARVVACTVGVQKVDALREAVGS